MPWNLEMENCNACSGHLYFNVFLSLTPMIESFNLYFLRLFRPFLSIVLLTLCNTRPFRGTRVGFHHVI
jgi:hypothetical protein